MQRKNMRALLNFLFRTLARVDVQGWEHFPTTGPAIVCGNHLGIIDAPLAFALLPREDCTALVAKNYQSNWLISWIVNSAGGIWLNRDDADPRAIRAGLDHLKKGGILGIAPEGTRSSAGGLQRPKTGVAYFADKAEVPIVPMAFYGSEHALSQMLTLRRPQVMVRFGPPFRLPALERSDREAGMRANADEIMCHIAVLLPEQYWGAYRDHTRLKALLER